MAKHREDKVDMRVRVLEIQSHTHDMYGNPWLTPDMIDAYVQKNKSRILFWCWILHDKDVYTVAEYQKALSKDPNTQIRPGALKPRHIHFVVSFKNATTATAFAKAFNLTVSMVQIPESQYRAFMDKCIYLTHEDAKQQALGKHLYADSEIHCNFNFREEVNKHVANLGRAAKRKMKKVEVDSIIESVVSGERTLEDVENEFGFPFYLDYEKKFDKARQKYIVKNHEQLARYNYYFDGVEGVGKTQLAKMFARALFPHLSADECYYEVTDVSCTFIGYRGQPVIIWSDMRAVEMVTQFKRNLIYNIFENHPGKNHFNIKYGSVILINTVNIVNGIESYIDFLNGLAGTFVDKTGKSHKEPEGQIYRRFPFISQVTEDSFTFYVSRGWLNNTREYKQYEEYNRVRGNIAHAMKTYNGHALIKLGSALTAPMVELHNEAVARESIKITDVDEILPEDAQIEILGHDAILAENKQHYIEYLEDFKAHFCNISGSRSCSNDVSFCANCSDFSYRGGLNFDSWKLAKPDIDGGYKYRAKPTQIVDVRSGISQETGYQILESFGIETD